MLLLIASDKRSSILVDIQMKVLDQGAMGQISGEEISLIGGTPNS
jgi:hypothetical protein